MPKVSVIIPIYNPPKSYIKECLESVFSQTFQDFEVIVVDDGSTLNTKEMLNPYRNQIRYFYKEKEGVNPARALGLIKAQGKYIALNDQDDIWLPNKLQKQVEFLDNYPELDLIFSDLHHFSDQGFFPTSILERDAVLRKIPYKSVSNISSNARIFTNNILYDYMRQNFIWQSSLMARKEICEKVEIFKTKTNVREFYEFGLRSIHLLKIGFIDETLAHHRIHANNALRNYELLLKNTSIICEDALNYPWMDAQCQEYLHRQLLKSNIILGVGYFLKGRFSESRKPFKKIIRHTRLHFRYLLASLSLKMVIRHAKVIVKRIIAFLAKGRMA